MDELGLENGQTISDTLFGAVLEGNLGALEADIAMKKLTASDEG